jgi:hypothetical protein
MVSRQAKEVDGVMACVYIYIQTDTHTQREIHYLERCLPNVLFLLFLFFLFFPLQHLMILSCTLLAQRSEVFRANLRCVLGCS